MTVHRRGAYKHYRNFGDAGETVFATTTALDFAPIFLNRRHADIAVGGLLSDCRHYGAPLHAFVVMSNHIHLVFTVPDDKTASWLMNRLKSACARRMVPRLEPSEHEMLSYQVGLNRHAFWKESYRSFVVHSEKEFAQKVNYVHFNPVRARLCAYPEEYRWSSAPLWYEDRWEPVVGLHIDDSLIGRYCDIRELAIRPSSAGADEG